MLFFSMVNDLILSILRNKVLWNIAILTCYFLEHSISQTLTCKRDRCYRSNNVNMRLHSLSSCMIMIASESSIMMKMVCITGMWQKMQMQELANKTRFDFPGRYMQVALARCCLSPKTQAPAISLLTHPEFVVWNTPAAFQVVTSVFQLRTKEREGNCLSLTLAL